MVNLITEKKKVKQASDWAANDLALWFSWGRKANREFLEEEEEEEETW